MVDRRRSSQGSPSLAGWAVGAAFGLLVVGRSWVADSIALLDLVVGPRIQVPPGVWGLGPELPRRGFFVVPLAWASAIIPGPVLFCAVAVVAMAAAAAGVQRLCDDAPGAARLGAGALYAANPYLLTRLGVGHLGLVVAAALLPWALPTLAAPAASPRRTFLWSLAFAACGSTGAVVGALLALVGWALDRGRRMRALMAIALPHLLWAVPGAVVAWQTSAAVTSSASFATEADGPLELAALVGGSGFWAETEQVGPRLAARAIAGAVLLVLAGLGARRLHGRGRRPATVAAGLGLTLALASALPGLQDLTDSFTATAIGAPLREGQRFLVLPLLWLCVAAAHGAGRLQQAARAPAVRALAGLSLGGLAIALAAPALGGLHGRLDDAGLASDWTNAQALISARPGTVAALPLSQYTNLPGSGRRVLNPAAQVLDADVLESTDPGFGVERTDEADPRVAPVAAALTQLRDEGLADDLAEVGVRWLAVVPGVDARLEAALRARPGFVVELDRPTMLLVRNDRWRGPARRRDGTAMDVDQPLAPVARVAADAPVRWSHPAAPGWVRGWERAHVASDGTLLLPEGRGLVWFWPAVPVSLVHVLLFAVAAVLIRREWTTRPKSSRPPTRPDEDEQDIPIDSQPR